MAQEETSRGRRGGRRIWVRQKDGTLQPYLRGMVTHDLMLRGLSFEDAYALARAVRDRIADRGEIEGAELEDLIQEELERAVPGGIGALASPVHASVRPSIVYEGGSPQPFSRGILARSLRAAGLDGDRAYRIATDVQNDLIGEGVDTLGNDELAARIGEVLEEVEGEEPARRYRTMRRVGRLPRPLVIYIAGATGTGKSTLALELAPLLGVYQINATDTIRQVMRMVFSPAILPGLHRSSFEGQDELAADTTRPEAGSRILAAFEEQATRVCVGVRAVVERALAENVSVVLEGVHLAPPLVPFTDLAGAAFQVMLMLSTLDEEVHRSRFVSRGAVSGRQAEHYLQNFQAIREIQDLLLLRAETYDVPVLDTRESDPVVSRSLRLISSALAEQVPWIAEPEQEQPVPTLCLFIDGLADRPVRALGGRTPLQAADTPTLDRLAAEGATGRADPVQRGAVSDTSSGTLALFGQVPEALARGPVEAVGVGLEMEPGDVALRGNFATLDEAGRILDRRAGRIRAHAAELAADLDLLEVEVESGLATVRVRAATEHRIAIVLQGEGLSSAIVGSDPGDGTQLASPLDPRARDAGDAEAAHTAALLAAFEERARAILAEHPLNRERRQHGQAVANAILTRGPGRIHRLERPHAAGRPLEIVCIGGDYTVLGVAGSVGGKIVTDTRMTANLDSDLGLKLRRARKELGQSDLVVVHVKGADIAAHDRRPDLKVEFLEKLDRELARFLEKAPEGIRIAVAADHATLSEIGQHGADPVPVLLWGKGVEPDGVRRFDEAAVAEGRLGRFPLGRFLARVFEPGL